ncbi:MucR family transcriptional regulator [Geotalea sp. SG265]|uniref:MucR family transcriptional regulator n=1 Tax=Geotalea sp. SG265 TaxID=2922867 RepID=UPI001FAF7021|nr:MucR family transcriptional regulator [Geotalea sp. SG265]
MSTLTELAAQIVSSHASTSPMTTDDLIQELQKVHSALKGMETGGTAPAAEEKPALTVKEAIKKNEIICMVCGKGGFKTLARHLNQAHGMKPGEYKKQFGIPSKQPLAAKSFSDARRKMAQQNNLAANLEKARAVRKAKIEEKKKPVKAAAKKPAAKRR